MLKEKLKFLNDRLRWWNKKVFGWLDLKLEYSLKELHDLDVMLGVVIEETNIDMVNKRIQATKDIRKNLQYTEKLLRQKSIQRWINEADQNTRFFHNLMRSR